MTPGAILNDPALLPHRVAWDAGRVDFVRTSRERLRGAAFLDGRSDFSAGEGASLPLASVRDVAAPEPDRIIFHVGFCGSTLLARLLDVAGRALVLREPQALVDLADARATLDRAGRTAEPTPHLSAIRSLLRRPLEAGEPVLVKPSNWANPLLAELCAEPRAIRPLFLTIGRERFVRAVYRGGPERIAFSARAALHLSSAGTADAELVAESLGGGGGQAMTLARLAAVLHHIQVERFARVAQTGGWGAAHMLRFEDLATNPEGALLRAEAALEIDLGAGRAASLARWQGAHAKDAGEAFSPASEAAAESAALIVHGPAIASALEWAERRLG